MATTRRMTLNVTALTVMHVGARLGGNLGVPVP